MTQTKLSNPHQFPITTRFTAHLAPISDRTVAVVATVALEDPRYDALKPKPRSQMYATHDLSMKHDPTYREAWDVYERTRAVAHLQGVVGAAFMRYVEGLPQEESDAYWKKFLAIAARNGVALPDSPANHDIGGAMMQILDERQLGAHLQLVMLALEIKKEVGLLQPDEGAIADYRKSGPGDGERATP